MSTDKMPNRQNVDRQMYVISCMQNTNETIAKYAVDDNLFRLGSTNPKKKYPAPALLLVGGEAAHQNKMYLK